MCRAAGACNRYPQIDFQDLSYYSAPKRKSEKVLCTRRLAMIIYRPCRFQLEHLLLRSVLLYWLLCIWLARSARIGHSPGIQARVYTHDGGISNDPWPVA